MKPEHPIYILVGLLIIAVSVLTGLGDTVPTQLWILLSALIAGGLGLTVPGAVTSSAPPPTTPAVPVAAVPTAAATSPAALAAQLPADPFTAPTVAVPVVTQ